MTLLGCFEMQGPNISNNSLNTQLPMISSDPLSAGVVSILQIFFAGEGVAFCQLFPWIGKTLNVF